VLAGADQGLPKLWVIARALDLRRRRPEALGVGGSYTALAAAGSRANHVFAYRRGEAVLTVLPRLVLRLARTGGWSTTALPLPEGRWRNVLDLREHEGPARVRIADLLARFPVALLERVA
jgi:(1->4)-alpha-D-glucan 1-alpha-D-glucosylmutase